jgi:hypothetical protein
LRFSFHPRRENNLGVTFMTTATSIDRLGIMANIILSQFLGAD